MRLGVGVLDQCRPAVRQLAPQQLMAFARVKRSCSPFISNTGPRISLRRGVSGLKVTNDSMKSSATTPPKLMPLATFRRKNR